MFFHIRMKTLYAVYNSSLVQRSHIHENEITAGKDVSVLDMLETFGACCIIIEICATYRQQFIFTYAQLLRRDIGNCRCMLKQPGCYSYQEIEKSSFVQFGMNGHRAYVD